MWRRKDGGPGKTEDRNRGGVTLGEFPSSRKGVGAFGES